MKTLVIHPQDPTTDFLSEIYSDKKDWLVVNTNISNRYLKSLIKQFDRIIMLGHGTESGLLGFNKFVIDSTLVYLLREKQCVCIWCNANVFVEKYGLKGFYTGMIISEYQEAILYCVPTTDFQLDKSNLNFALAIKHSIDSHDMLLGVKRFYDDPSNAVVEFNRENLFHSDTVRHED